MAEIAIAVESVAILGKSPSAITGCRSGRDNLDLTQYSHFSEVQIGPTPKRNAVSCTGRGDGLGSLGNIVWCSAIYQYAHVDCLEVQNLESHIGFREKICVRKWYK
jgi:hypothetical protein